MPEYPTELLIEVTKDDILRAREASLVTAPFGAIIEDRANTCPIAQCLKRMGYEDVSVGETDFGIHRPEDFTVEYVLPPSATAFVHEADAENDFVDPISFVARKI
jgi:hypothetical protein